MPTYEYACTECNHHFDLRQGFDAETVSECPECASEARRVLTMPAIVYNAPGFYTSDARRNGPGNYWYNRERKEQEGSSDSSSHDDHDGDGGDHGSEAASPETIAGPVDQSESEE